jgi:hypothetical protein
MPSGDLTARQNRAMRRRWSLWLDLVVKSALVGLLLFAVVRPDLPQFEGKAMVARAFLYPISALIVPVCSGFAEALGAEYFTSSATRRSCGPPTRTHSATWRSAWPARLLPRR